MSTLSLSYTHTDSLGPNSSVARPKHESPCEQWRYSEGSRWDGRRMKDVVRDPDWSWSSVTVWTQTGNMFNSQNLETFHFSFYFLSFFLSCFYDVTTHTKACGGVWLSNGVPQGSVLSPLLFLYILNSINVCVHRAPSSRSVVTRWSKLFKKHHATGDQTSPQTLALTHQLQTHTHTLSIPPHACWCQMESITNAV